MSQAEEYICHTSIFICEMADLPSTSCVNPENPELQTCNIECKVGYGDFCVIYTTKTEKLVEFAQRQTHFAGYLSVSYFKIHHEDPTTRLHTFLTATTHLYPPTP